jgi:hypothetical protein
MPNDFTGATSVLPRSLLPTPEDPAERMGLMFELETSLLASQTAVVRLDLEGIHRGTREQAALVAKLAAMWPCSTAGPSSVLAQELRQCELRTLQAARVQAALLSRSRSKLRIMANMLAGPSVTYGPLAVTDFQPAPALSGIEKS